MTVARPCVVGGVIWNYGNPPRPPSAKGGKMKFSL